MSLEKPKPAWVNFLIGGASAYELEAAVGRATRSSPVCANPYVYHALCATCSRCVSMMATCIVQPNDLIKTRMQLLGPSVRNESMITVARNVIKKEGVNGLYSGMSAALFRQITYTTVRLGVFNSLMDMYKDKYGESPSLLQKLSIGCAAGAFGAFVGTPADVCLIRMTADGHLPLDKRRNYKNVFNVLNRITKEEGIKTLWSGTGATITRAMVVNAAQLGTYSQTREILLYSMDDGLPLHFVSSMISGLVTSAASLPADIVKTRVQNAVKGAGQLTVLKTLIASEGVLALWSGFIPTYLKIGPHTVFSFIFMEQLNGLYRRLA